MGKSGSGFWHCTPKKSAPLSQQRRRIRTTKSVYPLSEVMPTISRRHEYRCSSHINVHSHEINPLALISTTADGESISTTFSFGASVEMEAYRTSLNGSAGAGELLKTAAGLACTYRRAGAGRSPRRELCTRRTRAVRAYRCCRLRRDPPSRAGLLEAGSRE